MTGARKAFKAMFAFPDVSKFQLYCYDKELVFPSKSVSADMGSIDILKERVNDYGFILCLVEYVYS
jgi:hypothetical protein